MCVLILLYMWPHTNIYVASYYSICALTLLCMCPRSTICVLMPIYVSSYYCMCSHTNIYLSLSLLCVCVCQRTRA